MSVGIGVSVGGGSGVSVGIGVLVAVAVSVGVGDGGSVSAIVSYSTPVLDSIAPISQLPHTLADSCQSDPARVPDLHKYPYQ